LYSILMSFRNWVMGDKSVILERLILNVNEQILSLK
jgi:hypothetical protein